MAPTKIKLRLRKKEKGSTKSSQRQRQQSLRPETSPDSKCPICLDRFVNVASVERCLHRFCFRCIREWAKNKAECPLCKQPFRSIFHSVKAENDFKEFVVLEDNTSSATTSASATVAVTAAAIAVAPAGQNNAESTATRPRRSRATRTRRSQRAQDPAPSASSVDGVALDHATLVQRDPACLRQLLPWLRRERVMGANPSELRPFLLARTDHILHELVSFARSIEAMQCPPTPSYEEDSGSQSSIINISEDDDSEEADVTEDTTQERVPPVPMATSSEISLSQSAWDDETPGPSYSTLGHPQTEEVEPEGNQLGGTGSATEQREHNDDDNDEDECMIVGYVKPMAERTPELVQLSSDSTEEEEAGNENEAAVMQPVMKAELSLPSQEQAPLSPKPYPSTSHTERGDDLEQSREQDPGKLSHHRRKHHTLRRGFRKTSHSLSGSRSQTSSESSPPSGHSIKIGRSHVRLSCGEPRRHLSGRSPAVIAEKGCSSSEELFPTRSISTRDKSSKSFSAWDSPGHDGERKKKRRKRRRERETERSRSPHRDSRHRHGDRELWLRSSCSSSSDADSHREKPAGKRKYKTRHLERTACRRSSGKSRERERSPSVEIIFERRAPDAHSRGRRRRKRSRRKEREQNSPTVITIDSDSGSDRTADRQNNLVDDDRDDVANDHAVEYQDHTADDNERVTDFSDHTIDYQERLAEFSDRTADDKDCVTDRRNGTDDYRRGVQKVSDQAAEHQDHTADVRSHAADYKHSVTQDNSNSADYKKVSGYTPDSKRRAAEVTDRTTDYQESLLDIDDSPDDFQDSVTEIRNRGESTASLLDMLNLEQCLVDVVQPIRRVEDDSHRAATPLSDTQLLELEDSLLGEGQGALRNGTVDQQEAGFMAHTDPSETEHERDSRISEP